MKRSLSVFAIIALLMSAGCGDSAEPAGPDDAAGGDGTTTVDPGALVRVSMDSQVGVVLDEIPEALRDEAAAGYLGAAESFWRNRAAAQVLHTTYRLVYRNFFYDDKGMMALPPREVWDIQLGEQGARRQSYQGHDAVIVDYRFEGTLLSDPDSPAEAEPELAEVGGVWPEPFVLPLDPEFLFQRTGYSCLDEEGYPLRTAESENAWQLFDQECDVETPGQSACHVTEFPVESCVQALEDRTGRVDTELRFERLAWDDDLADDVRVADYASTDGPDLEVIGDGLKNNRIVWRYFEPDSCALEEGCVGGFGWRRLLEFDASIRNASTEPLTVGEASPQSPFAKHNNLILSDCHDHYHYGHYGDFRYGDIPGDKRAFCIESTDRYFNSEDTPLVHPYSCDLQGVASGWGDTYIAGIECNWIDITDLNIPASGMRADLRFQLNPDDFICEGAPVVDERGDQLFEPTDIIGENGRPVDRPLCDFVAGFDDNNLGLSKVVLPPDGGFITSPCTRGQAGPLRDCGWQEAEEGRDCEPGETVTLRCQTTMTAGPSRSKLQALRICERSAEHGDVIACMFREALASVVVGPEPTEVSFTCPEARPPREPGGLYGWFTAGVLADSPAEPITCEVAR
jgi:hypothetical protein